MILERAVNRLHQFPSIAEMKEIADGLQRDKSPGTSHGKKLPLQEVEKPVEQYPWPNSIIGLIMCIFDPKGVPTSALRTMALTLDEAEYLHSKWLAKDWNDTWALELIDKSNARYALQTMRTGAA